MTKVSNTMATEVKLDTVSAASSLKTLSNAIKASTSAWKANEVSLKSSGDYLKAAEAKYKGIGETIGVVQDKVTKLREKQQSLDTSTKEGSEQYSKLSTQLAQTENKLASLTAQQSRAKSSMEYYKSGLGDLQKSFKSVNEVTNSYVERLQAEGKEAEAQKARLGGLSNSVDNLGKQYKVQSDELARIKKESGEASDAYKQQEIRLNKTATTLAKTTKEQQELDKTFKSQNMGFFGRSLETIKGKLGGVKKESKETGESVKHIGMGFALGSAISNGASQAFGWLKGVTQQGYELAEAGGVIKKQWTNLGLSNGTATKMTAQIGDIRGKANMAGGAIDAMQKKFYATTNSATKARALTEVLASYGSAAGKSGDEIAQMSQGVAKLSGSAKVTSSLFQRTFGKVPELQKAIITSSGMSTSAFNKALAAGKITGTQLQAYMVKASKTSGKAWDEFSETSKGKLASLQGTYTNLKVAFAKPLTAGVEEAIDSITKKKGKLDAVKTSLTALVTKAGAKTGQYIGKFIKFLVNNQKAISTFAGSLISIVSSLGKGVWDVVAGAIKAIGGHSKDASKGLSGVAKATQTIASHKKGIEDVGKAIAIAFAVGKIVKFVSLISDVIRITKLWTAAQWLFNVALDANPIGIAVVAIGALAAGFYEAYKHIKPFRDAVNGVASAIGKWAKGTFKSAEKALSSFGKTVKNVMKGIGEFFTGKLGWEQAISHAIGKMTSSAKKAFKPVSNVFKSFIKGIQGIFKGFGKILEIILIAPLALEVGIAIKTWQKIKKPVMSVVNAIKSGVSKGFKAVAKVVSNVWKGITSTTKKAWNSVYKYVISPVTKVYKAVTKYIGKLVTKTISKAWKTIKSLTHSSWLLVQKYIVKPVEYIWKIIQKYIIKNFVKGITKTWDILKDLTHDAWLLIKKYTVNPVISAYKTVSKWINKLLNTITNVLGSIKKVWNGIWNSISDTFKGIWKNIKSIAQNGINDVISILNTGIGGIDSVIHAFGGKKKAIGTISKVHLATGTGVFSDQRKAITKPTMAVLNDGNDSPETGNKEILVHPNGMGELIHGRNVMRFLEPGAEVMNASESKLFMGMQGVTHFAKGSNNWFGNIMSGIGSGIGDVTGWVVKKAAGLKKFFTTAEKIIAHPIKSLDSMFNYTKAGAGVVEDITKGMFNNVKKQAANWWSSLWSMVDLDGDGGATGSGTRKKFIEEAMKLSKRANYKYSETKGRLGPNYYDCSGLVYEALKHIGVTLSGSTTVPEYNSTHSVSWGKAVPGDLAFWGAGGTDHVGIVTSTNGAGRMWNAENPTDGIKSNVIKGFMGGFAGLRRIAQLNGGKGDDSSSKKGTGNTKDIKSQVGSGFFKFMHKLADMFGDNSSNTGSSAKPTGDHMHWLKQAGIPTSDYGMYNYIITKESGWNPKATNSGSGAYGLPQSLPASKMARSGSDWKTNPITQLKWMKWYVNDGNYHSIRQAYNHEKSIGWYANGGISRFAKLAHISEGNKTESIVPWDITKRARAYQVMDTTMKEFAKTDKPQQSTTQSTQAIDLSELIKQGKEIIGLMAELISGQQNPVPAVVSANDIYSGYNQVKTKKSLSKNLGRGYVNGIQ
ncbi:tape measure protein [Lactiplantibacillus mudanjiangensis]|uniref:Phage tail tape measure protein [Lactobacillus brevis] n=1 Tax=Lactiplantibacillus mudanjiangensis TaxID=1296538 RepID=A0A660E263_9LACO|nr:tape measure protein [Lactiplantibacillus mudanjiangensis]VDG24238.1 phage tail tape measure protein [Lactobacillus brevis] [Lactiplantibacillus mudanjiangensis]VDG30216.1 phage tail tape measure protein [Lactobacillus brevis] [Lactiplantibacillus mudanjiangensis]